MSYKIHYFPLRGRAELTRAILALAGQSWEDVTYNQGACVCVSPLHLCNAFPLPSSCMHACIRHTQKPGLLPRLLASSCSRNCQLWNWKMALFWCSLQPSPRSVGVTMVFSWLFPVHADRCTIPLSCLYAVPGSQVRLVQR